MCDHSDDVDELSASDDSEPEEHPSRAPFDPELDTDDDDDDDDDDDNRGDGVVSAPAAQTSFSLRGGNSAFSNRSHSIFDSLDTQLSSSTQKQHNTSHGEFVQPHPPQSSRKKSHPPSSSPTPPKKRGVPDYLVHPERWTHYSLEDVSETSDQDNRKAAHQFLSSLQQEKRTDSASNVQQRMVFSRPKKELTAGQLLAVRENSREMHLSHLEEEEDEREGKVLEKARGRQTDQTEGKMEEKDTKTKTERPEEEKRKEKDEEDKIEEVNHSFTSFRKTKIKNYRKSSAQEDN